MPRDFQIENTNPTPTAPDPASGAVECNTITIPGDASKPQPVQIAVASDTNMGLVHFKLDQPLQHFALDPKAAAQFAILIMEKAHIVASARRIIIPTRFTP